MNANKYGMLAGFLVAIMAAIITVISYLLVPQFVVVVFIGVFLVAAGLALGIVSLINQKRSSK